MDELPDESAALTHGLHFRRVSVKANWTKEAIHLNSLHTEFHNRHVPSPAAEQKR